MIILSVDDCKFLMAYQYLAMIYAKHRRSKMSIFNFHDYNVNTKLHMISFGLFILYIFIDYLTI